MAVIIPKKVTNGKELVIIPREDWEKLQKIARMKISQIELERGLKEALKEVKEGKVRGPFGTVEALIKDLENESFLFPPF